MNAHGAPQGARPITQKFSHVQYPYSNCSNKLYNIYQIDSQQPLGWKMGAYIYGQIKLRVSQ